MHGFMRSAFAPARAALFAVAWLVLLPATSFAQATLAGTVQDASGAVLPGVIPKVDVQLSTSFQFKPGTLLMPRFVRFNVTFDF